MSITKISTPSDWARVNDTNRMTYYFSSNKWNEPNFQFYFNLRVYNVDGTYTDCGNYKLFPDSGGTVEFNPSEIYRNFFNTQINLSRTALDEETTGARKTQLFVYDYYGSPPEKKTAGSWSETTPLNCYDGCQQSIPYDYAALNAPLQNLQWVMSGVTGGQGKFLTDTNNYRMDNTDYGFLYALGPKDGGRPDRIKYTIYYWSVLQNPCPDGPLGIGLTQDYMSGENQSQSLPMQSDEVYMDTGVTLGNYSDGEPGGGGQPVPSKSGITQSILYDTSISFHYDNSLKYYFPMGPYQCINNGILSGYTNRWVYYDIDLYNGTKLLNKVPFRVYKQDKCLKYDPWQLFWLNPHGGYDTFTFTAKKDIVHKISRETYKQKLDKYSYNTYAAGEKVFNTSVVEEITLRTHSITQQEAQLLMQLAECPVVYVLRTYKYGGTVYPYGVPYIPITDTATYPIKKNDKEIYFEIKIRPSNQKIIQKQ